MKPRSLAIVVPLALLPLALWVGFHWGQQRVGETPGEGDAHSAATSEEPEVLYWYDPMVPDQHFDKPGKSPFMDMDLVPRYADSAARASIAIEPGVQQNLGLRTATVELDSVPERIRVPGSLSWNLRDEVRVAARVEALVEAVHVRTPFQRVRRGQSLASLLAPGLSNALADYRLLAAAESAEARRLAAAARQRLQLLGLDSESAAVSAAGAAPRIVLRAPRDGVASEILLREGDTVMAGQTLFRLNGDDDLWLELRVPQRHAAGLQAGDPARVFVDGLPEYPLSAEVEAVLPQIDPQTRTQGVRLLLNNARRQLAEGQFAEAELQIADDRRCPWIPGEALIQTGREARVILRDKQGRFLPRTVQIGRRVADRVEILDGLSGGEDVVVSGQFLIDSEASLSGLLARLNAASDATEHAHGATR